VPITVTFRVIGTEEEGSATLAAAPVEDPAFSEALMKRTPPGHYMLFILNGSGVPSVAKIAQVR
jgi:hypothetical protein